MPSIIETYALATASKIGKPYIYESFITLPSNKYITIQAESSKVDAKKYSYVQSVINMIFPLLQKHNISIVQVGVNGERIYQYVNNYVGQTNFGQLAYIIKNSSLHFGPDSLCVHLASGYDIPIVGLYSFIQSKVSGPYWGDKNKQILFDAYLRVGNKKPSYSNQESPKSIDLIKPEEIANAIFKLLNIDFKYPFETIYIGKNYTNLVNKINEIIPSGNPVNFNNPQIQAEIRMDINFDEQFLIKQLSTTKCVVWTNKPINLDILKNFKPNIHSLIYEITENDDPKFALAVRKLGILIAFYSKLPTDQINNKKINYYEIGKINEYQTEKPEKILELKSCADNLYYTTNKIVIANNKIYCSESARIKDIPITNDFEFQKVIDIPEFWNDDLQFTHIIKKN